MQQDHKALLQSEGFKQLYAHQFDDTTRVDGLPYACSVNACLLGGPITEDALAWWGDFMTDDSTDKKNHLTRAMLGNQVDFFDWLGQPSQAATIWAAMPGIMNEELLTRNVGAALRDVVAQSLVSNSASVAAFKAKAGLMNTTARQKFKKLVQAIGGQSEKGLQLYKLTVPSDVLGQFWKGMSADVQRAWPTSKKLGDYSIKSLVMPASTSMELTGAAGASNATVDLYIWSDRQLDADDLSVAAKKGEYQITLAETKAAGAAPLVASINLNTAEELVQKSMNVIKRASSGILSAVAFFLQTQLVIEAWDKLKKGTDKEQQAAAYTLLTFGLGASAALMEVGEQALTLMKKEVMASKLRFVAGIASALAAAVSAVQAAIAAVRFKGDGDDDAFTVSVLQTIFFISAAGVLLTGVFVSGEAVLMGVGLGLSWTGWGLVLVALGCVASLVVMFVKDKPLESWAAHTIWGDADEDKKYRNLQTEQSALNETLMGVSIDFECDKEGWLGNDMEEAMQSTLLLSAATAPLAVAYAETNVLANSWSWAADVRATLPKSVKDEMAWVMQIYADKIGVGRQLVAQRSWKDIGTTFVPEQVYDEDIDGNPDLIRLVLSAKLDCNHYRKPVAIVRIASASQHEGDPDLLEGSVIVARRLSA